MNRVKAVYRSWAIPCAGQRVYAPRYRSQWLGKIAETGVRRRAEIYYQQLLPIAGVETARKVAESSLPSNQLMQRAETGGRGKR
jgi:hypothetical protein